MGIDISLNEFEKFIHNYEILRNIDISEMDTRSKIIDKVLIDILHWKEDDIQREGHVDSGYYDYKISLSGFHLIVEAKRQFKLLQLPVNTNRVTIKTIYKENEDVIKQIRKYTSDSGIDFGIITNGSQFIVGQFVNHNGKYWMDNQVLLFNGFEDIKHRFVEFYNNLAKRSIISNGGFQFILDSVEEKPKKIISTLVDRDKEIVRNSISSQIAQVIEMIFGEIFNDKIEDEEEFIKECFVENKETIKNRSELNNLFDDRAPELEEVRKARNLDSLVNQIEDELSSIPVVAKITAPPNPIIIVGTKGAGKTTFINYLFNNKLEGDTLKNHPYVYVDFIKYYREDKTIDTEKISDDILGTLYENYSSLKLHTSKVLKRVYYKEIQRNDDSIWEDLKANDINAYNRKLNEFLEKQSESKQNHLELLSKYMIRERRIRLIIVIDNADQFDMNVQEKVFLFANSLNKNALCGVFVSLREGYYYKWRFRPPFNAFISNVYHVTAPPYSEVLQRRIDYTLKKISRSGKLRGISGSGAIIEMNEQNIIEFLAGLQDSLFEDNNKSIIDFLNYSTFPNIREGLNLFKMFFISGYTDVHEYILRVRFNEREKNITIPLHEFVKSIGFYNKIYYNHEISVIPNIFYPCEKSNNHFIKSWILKYLKEKWESGGNINKFEQSGQIIELFTNFGYRYDIVLKTIQELLTLELIDSDEVLSDIKWNEIPEKDFNISISPKGYYYISEFKNRFHYLDMVLQDTPIYDDSSFTNLKTAFPHSDSDGKRNLSGRLETVKIFIKYLEHQEKKESNALIRRFGSIVEEIRFNGLLNDLDRISRKVPT